MLNLNANADARAVGRVLRGRTEAFEPLTARYIAAVRALAFAQTGNWSDAEDVAQEAFLQAFRKLESLKEPRLFGPWLMRIARNRAMDLVAARRRNQALNERVSDDAVVMPDAEARELSEVVQKRIMELESGPREILLLRYYGGKRVREVAKLLQISTNAANKRLSRAREALGKTLLAEIEVAEAKSGKIGRRVARIMAIASASPLYQARAVAASGGVLQLNFSSVAVPMLIVAGCVFVGYRQFDGAQSESADIELFAESSSSQFEASDDFSRMALAAAIVDSGDPATIVATPRDIVSSEPQPEGKFGGISGRLTDVDGHPLVGWFIAAGHYPPYKPISEVVTDKEGVFDFVRLSPGTYHLGARQYATEESMLYRFGQGGYIEAGKHWKDKLLVIDIGRRMWGRVTDSDGVAIPGARVQTMVPRIIPVREGGVEIAQLSHDASGSTDARGKYEVFESAQWNDVVVTVTAPDENYLGAARRIPTGGGEQNFVLLRPAILHGRVVSAETGRPIRSFKIGFQSHEWGENDARYDALKKLEKAETTVEAGGRFSLALTSSPHNRDFFTSMVSKLTEHESKPSANFAVFVSADGYANATETFYDIHPERTIDDVVIELSAAKRIHGSVVNEAGTPLQGARISRVSWEGRHWLAKTDSNGAFSLEATYPGMETLSATKMGYATSWSRVESDEVRFVLSKGGEVQWHIFVDGEAAGARSGMNIEAVFPDGESRRYSARMRDGKPYRIRNVSEDAITTRVVWSPRKVGGSPSSPMWSLERPIEVHASRTVDVYFDFDTGYEGGLTGTIRSDGNSGAVSMISISTTLPDGDFFTVRDSVQSDGTYSLSGLPDGSFEGEIRAADSMDATSPPLHRFRGEIVQGEVLLHDFELSW